MKTTKTIKEVVDCAREVEVDRDKYGDLNLKIEMAKKLIEMSNRRFTTLLGQYKSLESYHAMLFQALKDLVAQIDLRKLTIKKDFSLLNAHASATKAIQQSEEK